MRYLLMVFFLLAATVAHATDFAMVRGIVHDPQHRPISGAQVTLHAAGSTFQLQATTNERGVFLFPNTPMGAYTVSASASGFASYAGSLTIASDTNPVVHIPLEVATTATSVTVQGLDGADMVTDSVTPTTLITRKQIEETPGADRTLGMQMITDYVPGAYMAHDMLHIDGGHQTSWLIDGISIPNTKIGSNVGPQIDPDDIDSLEVQRGSYSSDVGDRTYGVFNVLPRNGFERNRQAELRVIGGNFDSGEAELSFGNHSASTAWYASATGSRSNFGLATPVPSIHHDATNSGGAFFSVIRNYSAADQIRITGQLRQDFFQIPYDPNPKDYECASGYYCSTGLRDTQKERDTFLIANWVHTFSAQAVLSAAPFYHFNQANYDSPANDQPVATTWHQSSNYGGAQADLHADFKHNDFSTGLYSFYQHESDLFGTIVNDGSAPSQPNTGAAADAGLVEFYVSDHLHIGRYVTLLGGERFSFFRANLNEAAIYPRVGATIEIPRLHWVLRGFYGHFFQPAPLLTVSSSVLNYAAQQGSGENTFTPVPSERDEEHQFGIQVPYRGWLLDVANVKNRINNFLDHSNLGESNMYFPIAVDGALVRSWQTTLRSPRLARIGQFHLAYSNQIAEQRGSIVGGFTCSYPNDPACNPGDFAYAPVDHDQRHTLNTGFTATLPARTWVATNVYYGSGFVNGLAGSGQGPYQTPYLPAHTTFDLSAGHDIGENLKISASVINVTDYRVLLDNSVTIGGFHWNDPRTVSGELRYRFHF